MEIHKISVDRSMDRVGEETAYTAPCGGTGIGPRRSFCGDQDASGFGGYPGLDPGLMSLTQNAGLTRGGITLA